MRTSASSSLSRIGTSQRFNTAAKSYSAFAIIARRHISHLLSLWRRERIDGHPESCCILWNTVVLKLESKLKIRDRELVGKTQLSLTQAWPGRAVKQQQELTTLTFPATSHMITKLYIFEHNLLNKRWVRVNPVSNSKIAVEYDGVQNLFVCITRVCCRPRGGIAMCVGMIGEKQLMTMAEHLVVRPFCLQVQVMGPYVDKEKYLHW